MPITAVIAASNNGTNAIATGVPGSKFRVLAFVLSFSGNVNAKWQSGSTDMTGLFYGAAGVVVKSPTLPIPDKQVTPPGQFVTNSGDPLNLNLSGATAVGGYVVYEQILGSQ